MVLSRVESSWAELNFLTSRVESELKFLIFLTCWVELNWIFDESNWVWVEFLTSWVESELKFLTSRVESSWIFNLTRLDSIRLDLTYNPKFKKLFLQKRKKKNVRNVLRETSTILKSSLPTSKSSGSKKPFLQKRKKKER